MLFDVDGDITTTDLDMSGEFLGGVGFWFVGLVFNLLWAYCLLNK